KGESLAERLTRENRITREALAKLKEIGGGGGVWTLKSLLLESGLLGPEDLEEVARRHIHDVVGILVRLEKGRFGIDLNQIDPIAPMEEVGISEGLDVGEVLLGAAKEIDEDTKEDTVYQQELAAYADAQAGDAGYSLETGIPRDEKVDRIAQEQAMARESQRSHLLCSMLAELRSHSFEAEVSLLIMRYASEVASRGVLFVVKNDEICGLGQFGVAGAGSGKTADERVREIHIPIGQRTIFDEVVKYGQPYIGELPSNPWHDELLGKIGGNGIPLSVFALPLVCNDEPIFVFYGDNYPGHAEMTGIDELVALVNQASIVLEKLILERMLEEIRHSR
ncbi:MAG TPA: hypothetical protein VKJ45_23570, partial [Blastocatellia bacterium]|nr:hypothetical protein [Blastocatellia bacterium]